LEDLASQEDDPIVVAMSRYLLALDKMCDLQHVQVRRMAARVEAAEVRWCKARVELAKVKACAAHAKSHVVALEELLEQADHHNKLLRGVYLV
jgi:flagellar biosynthesis chaperone FliJ